LAITIGGVTQRVPVKNGTDSATWNVKVPPAFRRKLGLDQLRHPMVLVEERDGGLFLQAALAVPVRDFPKATIERWIARDEAEMAAFRAKPRKGK
jgi:hypothetical protein